MNRPMNQANRGAAVAVEHELTALGEDGTRKVMRSNVAELIGLPG